MGSVRRASATCLFLLAFGTVGTMYTWGAGIPTDIALQAGSPEATMFTKNRSESGQSATSRIRSSVHTVRHLGASSSSVKANIWAWVKTPIVQTLLFTGLLTGIFVFAVGVLSSSVKKLNDQYYEINIVPLLKVLDDLEDSWYKPLMISTANAIGGYFGPPINEEGKDKVYPKIGVDAKDKDKAHFFQEVLVWPYKKPHEVKFLDIMSSMMGNFALNDFKNSPLGYLGYLKQLIAKSRSIWRANFERDQWKGNISWKETNDLQPIIVPPNRQQAPQGPQKYKINYNLDSFSRNGARNFAEQGDQLELKQFIESKYYVKLKSRGKNADDEWEFDVVNPSPKRQQDEGQKLKDQLKLGSISYVESHGEVLYDAKNNYFDVDSALRKQSEKSTWKQLKSMKYTSTDIGLSNEAITLRYEPKDLENWLNKDANPLGTPAHGDKRGDDETKTVTLQITRRQTLEFETDYKEKDSKQRLTRNIFQYLSESSTTDKIPVGFEVGGKYVKPGDEFEPSYDDKQILTPIWSRRFFTREDGTKTFFHDTSFPENDLDVPRNDEPFPENGWTKLVLTDNNNKTHRFAINPAILRQKQKTEGKTFIQLVKELAYSAGEFDDDAENTIIESFASEDALESSSRENDQVDENICVDSEDIAELNLNTTVNNKTLETLKLGNHTFITPFAFANNIKVTYVYENGKVGEIKLFPGTSLQKGLEACNEEYKGRTMEFTLGSMKISPTIETLPNTWKTIKVFVRKQNSNDTGFSLVKYDDNDADLLYTLKKANNDGHRILKKTNVKKHKIAVTIDEALTATTVETNLYSYSQLKKDIEKGLTTKCVESIRAYNGQDWITITPDNFQKCVASSKFKVVTGVVLKSDDVLGLEIPKSALRNKPGTNYWTYDDTENHKYFVWNSTNGNLYGTIGIPMGEADNYEFAIFENIFPSTNEYTVNIGNFNKTFKTKKNGKKNFFFSFLYPAGNQDLVDPVLSLVKARFEEDDWGGNTILKTGLLVQPTTITAPNNPPNSLDKTQKGFIDFKPVMNTWDDNLDLETFDCDNLSYTSNFNQSFLKKVNRWLGKEHRIVDTILDDNGVDVTKRYTGQDKPYPSDKKGKTMTLKTMQKVGLTDNPHDFELNKFQGIWRSFAHEAYGYTKNNDGEYILDSTKDSLMSKLLELVGLGSFNRTAMSLKGYGDGMMVQRVKIVETAGSRGFACEFKLTDILPFKVTNFWPIQNLQLNTKSQPELRFTQAENGYESINENKWTGTLRAAMRRKDSKGDEEWDKSLADQSSLIIDFYDGKFLKVDNDVEGRIQVNGDMPRRFIYIQRDKDGADVLVWEQVAYYKEGNKEKQLRAIIKFHAPNLDDKYFDDLQSGSITNLNTWSYADDKFKKRDPLKERTEAIRLAQKQ